MLSLLYKHPRDDKIHFQEQEHIYTVEGFDLNFTSCTTFIKKFFAEFDADAVIAKMIKSGSLKEKYPGQTPEQVKLSWKTLGETSAKRGTRLHKFIEDFYNGVDDRIGMDDFDIEIQSFVRFHNELPSTFNPYRTEWYIYDEEYTIAGSIDMVYQVDPINNPKHVSLYDWKCCKEIKFTNRFERALKPITYLDNCNGIHYSLQLNLYKFILEKNYGLKVVSMHLVMIHRNHPTFVLIDVKDMQTTIHTLLTYKS